MPIGRTVPGTVVTKDDLVNALREALASVYLVDIHEIRYAATVLSAADVKAALLEAGWLRIKDGCANDNTEKGKL